MTPVTLGELAERFGLALVGDPGTVVRGVATLRAAGPDQIAFLANPAYRRHLPETRAAAVILGEADRDAAPGAVLVSRNPYADFARIAALFEPPVPRHAGIHPSAVIDPEATVEDGASIGPHVSVGPRTRIARGAIVGPGCVIGEDCVVGEGSELVARVTLVRRVRLGRRVLVHPGAVLGADGFGIAMDRGAWVKVPQLGGVVVGDDCEIGANTTIDRGALDDTVLEDGVKLDNLVQIGHNVRVGAHSAFAGCVGVAGSAKIGRHCTAGGGAIILGHLELVDHVHITAATVVTRSILKPGQYSGLFPFDDNASWEKNAATLRQLHTLRERLRALEKKSLEP